MTVSSDFCRIVNAFVNVDTGKFYRKMTFKLNLDRNSTVIVTEERGSIRQNIV